MLTTPSVSTGIYVMNIIQAIAKAHYAANETQVEQLAHAVALGTIGTECYLRVMVTHCQSNAGPRRGRRPKLDAEAQEAIIDKVHGQLYPAVQRGVIANSLGGGEVTQAEVNRRGTFARSTASDLRAFVARGGDIRTIEVPTVTRSWVRKFGKPAAAVPVGTRAERSFVRMTEAALKAAARIAKNNVAAARAHIESALNSFEELLGTLPEAAASEPADEPGTTTVIGRRASDLGHARTRVVPQLHRGA